VNNQEVKSPVRNVDMPLAYEATLALDSIIGASIKIKRAAKKIADNIVTDAWATMMCNIYTKAESGPFAYDDPMPGGP
jgi:hypothetical protein